MVTKPRIRLTVAHLTLICLTQAGCLESILNPNPAYSSRTATSYEQNPLEAMQQPIHPAEQRYMNDLAALRRGQQSLHQGVPLRASSVPVLPSGMVAEPARGRQGSLFGPGASRRRVTVPGALQTHAAPPPPEPTIQTPEPAAPTTTDAEVAAEPRIQPDRITGFVNAVVARAAAGPDDLDLQIQSRVLLAAAGRDAEALAPVIGLDAAANKRVSDLLRMIMALRDSRQVAPTPGEANDYMEALDELQEQLRAEADLQIPVIKLCKQVDDFGVYVPFASTTFLAGRTQPVIVYCEVRNYSRKVGPTGMYRVRLNMKLALYNAAGVLAQPVQASDGVEDVSASRRTDFFLRDVYYLNDTLAAGEYTLKVTVEDPIANKARTESITITLADPS